MTSSCAVRGRKAGPGASAEEERLAVLEGELYDDSGTVSLDPEVVGVGSSHDDDDEGAHDDSSLRGENPAAEELEAYF